MPKATIHLPSSVLLIEALLEGLVIANQMLIRSGLVPPSPLDAGVRYQREGSGLEEWRVATQVLKYRAGDCEDLNAWAVAGLRETGEDASARMILYRSGPRLFHAVGELSSGGIYDVCPALGMRTSSSNHKLPGR
jgi:hypothetical protein